MITRLPVTDIVERIRVLCHGFLHSETSLSHERQTEYSSKLNSSIMAPNWISFYLRAEIPIMKWARCVSISRRRDKQRNRLFLWFFVNFSFRLGSSRKRCQRGTRLNDKHHCRVSPVVPNAEEEVSDYDPCEFVKFAAPQRQRKCDFTCGIE